MFMPHCKAFNFGFIFHNNLNGSSGNHTGLSVKNISSNKSIKNLECYPAVLGWLFKFSEQLTVPTLKCDLETSWSTSESSQAQVVIKATPALTVMYLILEAINYYYYYISECETRRLIFAASVGAHIDLLVWFQIIALIWPTSFLSLRMLAISMIWHKYVLFHDFWILSRCC